VEKLTHGWFVVKNRSTKDIKDGVSMEQRHRNEHQFFKSAPWNALPRERVGVHALSRFLGQLLYDHIREEFPSLVAEIRSMVLQSREELHQLGPPRQHSVQQRHFLSKMATQYQRAVDDCLQGNYDCSWGATDPRKLRMRLQLENESFSRRLAQQGHTRAFRKSDDAADDEFPRQGKGGDIYDWIRQQYRESRGAELPGTVNPTVLERIFRVQAKSWRPLTETHVASIHKIVLEFNERLFQEIVAEDSPRGKLEARNARTVQSAKEAALSQMELIIKDEMEGILQTVNHYFADTLTASRKDRILCRLKKLGLNDDCGQSVFLKDITNTTHLSNEDQAVYDIHDILKAYYKVALKRFTDTIVLQVVERHYLGNKGPVRYFSAEYVSSLTDKELTEIADESYATSSARNETSAKLERLEKALEIAEQQFY
jgi:Dynamin central region